MFADIALRRKDMENRRGELSRAISSPATLRRQARRAKCTLRRALADTLTVLTGRRRLSGSEKHDAAMRIVNRVICRKDGAEVVFMPGLFGENQATPASS